MAWFRLDDKFHGNPKVMEAGNAAVGLYVRCATYCADHLTDGKVPKNLAKTYGKLAEIRALLSVGLWVENGDQYEMPDYLDFNPSRLQVEAERDAAKERMARKRSGDVRANIDRTFGGTSDAPTRPDPLEVKTADNYKSVPAESPRSPSYARQVTTRAAELRMAARATQPDDPDAWCAATSKAMLVEREQQIRDAHAQGMDVDAAARMLVGDAKPARDATADLHSARRFGASVKDMHWRDVPADLRDEYRGSFINELPYEGREAADPEAWAAAALDAYDNHKPQTALRAV